MTANLKRIISIVLMIVFAGILGTFWFLGTGNQVTDLQSAETSFSTIEFHSLYPGTHMVSDIRIEIPMHDFPDTMAVYAKQPMSEKEIVRIASDLGLNGEPTNESGWIFIREDPYVFSSQPGGRVITYDDETSIPGFSPEYIDSHLPSDDEAKKIADEFLTMHNIEPEGMKFTGTNHIVGYHSNKDEWVKSSESINVIYRHFIAKHEIFNEKLGLEVTINKTVRTMFWKWTRYTPYKEYPIISPQEAVDTLQKTGIVVLEDIRNPEKAMVMNVTIGYLGETRSKDLDLIPIYKIEGIVYENGRTAEFFQYLPASPEAAAELI